MVAEAARQAADAQALYQALARGLRSTADRSAFLRALGGGPARLEPTLGPPATAPAASTISPGAGTIAPAMLAAAQAALAEFMGPIARVLARQAAEQATSPADFLDRLCAHLTKPEETAALRRRLHAGVKPNPD
jgi:hypothetical protein